MGTFIVIIFVVLCYFFVWALMAMASRDEPMPDAPDTTPPPDYSPDITATTRRKMMESIK